MILCRYYLCFPSQENVFNCLFRSRSEKRTGIVNTAHTRTGSWPLSSTPRQNCTLRYITVSEGQTWGFCFLMRHNLNSLIFQVTLYWKVPSSWDSTQHFPLSKWFPFFDVFIRGLVIREITLLRFAHCGYASDLLCPKVIVLCESFSIQLPWEALLDAQWFNVELTGIRRKDQSQLTLVLCRP